MADVSGDAALRPAEPRKRNDGQQPGEHNQQRGNGRILGAFVLGLIPAIAGHMLWNGGTLVLFNNFLLFYLVVQVPLFVAAVYSPSD